MSQPWEDFQQGAATADAPSPEAAPWEDFQNAALSAPVSLKKDPNLESTTAGGTKGGGLNLTPFTKADLPDKNDVMEVYQDVSRPAVALPKFTIDPKDSKVDAVAKSAANLIISVPEFIESPLGIASAGTASVIPKVVAALFLGDTAKNVVNQSKEAGKDWDQMTDAEKASTVTELAGQTVMAAAMAHVAGGKVADAVDTRFNPAAMLARELNRTEPAKLAASVGGQPAPVVETVNKNPWDDFKEPGTKPDEGETKPAASETAAPPAETIVQPDAAVVPTTFAPEKNPAVASLGDGIDFAKIQKPHLVGVEAGLKLSPEDVPAIQALQKQSVGEMTAAAQKGDNEAFQALMGKNSFLGGVIEGAQRKGPNFDAYQAQKSSPPPEQPKIEAPATPPAEPEAQPAVPAADEENIQSQESRPVPTVKDAKAAYENLSMSAVGAIHEWETNQKIIETGIGPDGAKVPKKHIAELVARQPQVVENFKQAVAESNPSPAEAPSGAKILQAKVVSKTNAQILESGKWPNGKKLTKADRERLTKENQAYSVVLSDEAKAAVERIKSQVSPPVAEIGEPIRKEPVTKFNNENWTLNDIQRGATPDIQYKIAQHVASNRLIAEPFRRKASAEMVRIKSEHPEVTGTMGPEFEAPGPAKKIETPAQATAKVAGHVAEVKQSEGVRPAKEIKSELVSRLEKAIGEAADEDEYLKLETVKVNVGTRVNAAAMMEDMPLSEAKNRLNASGVRIHQKQIEMALAKHAPKIEINIPGDGDFTIYNTKQALTSVLERAKKIKTTSGEPVSIKYSGTSKADRDWIQKQVENQPNQPAPPGSGGKIVGMGAAIPEEFQRSQNSPTATKNETIERERAARGLPPAIEPARRSFGQVWDNAMAMIDRDPGIQDALIGELSKTPRAVTDAENALLLHRQIELQNEYGKLTQEMAQAYDDSKEFPNRMADVEELKPRVANVTDRLFELYEVNKKVGTETGRGLNARKMMAYEDYTLARMELDARAANGGKPLTESEHEKVRELYERIDRLRKEFDSYSAQSQERISQLEAEKALKELKAKPEPQVEPHIRIIADKIKTYFDSRASQAQKRLAGKTFSFEAALPDLIDLGVSTILSGAADFTIWSSRMLEKLDKSIEPHLKTLWDKSNKALDDHISKSVAPQNEPKVKRAARTPKTVQDRQKNVETKLKQRIEEGKLDEISAYVRKLARILIESGVTDRDRLIDTIHEKLKEFDPSITRRQTMDAISGYGDFKQLSKDEISKQLRDLKGQMQQIAKLEDMQAGQPPLKTGLERRIPSKEESRLIKLVNEAKREFQIPITDPNTQLKSALDTLKTRMQTRIDELRQKIADQDFLPRPQREPLKLDREALRIKAEYERAKLEFERALQEYRLKNRNTLEKVSDTLVKWRRGFLLSSPITLAKLTSAAIQRLTITPAEEAIGGAISAVVPQVAGKAQREGGFNSAAEAKAITEAFTTGMKDAADTLRTGTSPLDVLYGQGREGYVRESMSLPRSVIDFFGNIHAALKAPVKRAEFARAFQKRVDAAIQAGIDVTDPMVQTRLAVESYKDANRSIFLQDNRLVTAYKMFLAGLEQKNKETGKPTVSGKLGATAGRLMLPIVRVPTNIVAETFTYAFGSMTGSVRLANAFAKGFENLKPNEADLIMRELKKGSLGAVAMLLGYFNANNFGGYYQPGQKRDKNDVKFGNVKLFGHEIPSFLVHNPLLEVFQLGATIRRVEDSKIKGETQGLPSGIMAGALGLADEVPFVREMFGEIPKMFNPREQGSFLGELAKSVFVPQLIQWLANQTDKDQSGNTNPRSPQTAWQHVETGIPGLRKNVPEKKPNQLPQ